ncbi:efflux transporter outer membrane subunit [Candidatus Binatia bacterium]|nr:efflux transporter outer membrane subunit [Candidatus Binatia bacterium]
MTRVLAVIVTAVAVAGCAVGPNYTPPELATPAAYRGATETAAEPESFADLPWWQVFDDPVLQDLVREALQQNYDLAAAAARVEQARAQVGVTRAPLAPQLGYQGGASRNSLNLSSLNGSDTARTFNSFLGAFNLAWEIDIWGRVRRATEASVAELFAAEEVRRGVVLTLVADVAEAYLTLLELDTELEIARRTTQSFTDTLQLFARQFEGGYTSKLAMTRAQAALASAAAAIPNVERLIAIQENRLSVLLGRPPGSIVRGVTLAAARMPPQTPPGLPAELLRRRPDIRRAEQGIVAANAGVGVAVANFFPRLGLTALYGGASSELEAVFKGAGNVWTFGGTLAGPLFQGGALYYGYKGAEQQWEQALETYRQAVVQALAEVANALVDQDKLVGVRVQQELAVQALRESVRLATLRYVGGLATYYEVLEAQQQLFPAENALAQTERDQLVAVVQLYRALGGGWAVEPSGTPGRGNDEDFPRYPPGTGDHPELQTTAVVGR